jgi:hypothetical protein
MATKLAVIIDDQSKNTVLSTFKKGNCDESYALLIVGLCFVGNCV